MAIKFFHTPKNKKFNYTPRYYDEEKEELERRIRQIKRELGVKDLDESDKPYIPHIKGQMRGVFKRKHEEKKRANSRLIIILIILLALVYFLLYF
ncbi:MAG: hypothetical protein V2I54_02970 [Bacteroidales bacterium]|jgi:hypothetical protein|nr:hypothetical protein [Bacteroidales bacterium]